MIRPPDEAPGIFGLVDDRPDGRRLVAPSNNMLWAIALPPGDLRLYLADFAIADVKCFAETGLTFPGTGDDYAGFNVLLGVNGTGKSTLLQAMALLMLGSSQNPFVRWQDWPRSGLTHGRISGHLVRGEHDVAQGTPRKSPYDVRLWVTGDEIIDKVGQVVGPEAETFASNEPALILDPNKPTLRRALLAGPWSGRPGWFSAGYGPFRRLSGSDQAAVHAMSGGKPIGRFTSLFAEGAALIRCEPWLIDLYAQSIDDKLSAPEKQRAAAALTAARRVIDHLLPGPVQVQDVTSREVRFTTIGGVQVELSSLSDGYRSFLALVVDLLRLIEAGDTGLARWVRTEDTEDGPRTTVDVEGVVLIDEADAHLHPTWQRRLGFELTRVFPRVQFIVSTHSPFIAMAARPGGLFHLEQGPNGRVVIERHDSVRGARADQVLLGPLFGLDSTRDPETERLLAERTRLALSGRPLDEPARRRLDEIEAELRRRLTGPGDTLAEQDTFADARALIQARLAELDGRGR